MKIKSVSRETLPGYISILVNLVLFVLKYWVGIVTGSVAFMADAWHTLSDSLSSVFLILGLTISRKPADEEHPFGHGRAEWISAIFIGMLLAYIGFNFLTESIEKLSERQTATYGWMAITTLLISILGKEVLAQYSFRMGKKWEVKSLVADGWHHRSDALSSVIILVGVVFGGNFWWMDGILGIIVSLFIFYATFEIFRETTHILLGEQPNEATKKQLREVIHEVTGREVFLHHIHMHNYGKHKEITFHIRLPSQMSLEEAHQIATKIEARVQEKMNMQATIHMEPLT